MKGGSSGGLLAELVDVRAALQTAEDQLPSSGELCDAYKVAARRCVVNARGEVDEALSLLREEGKVD